MVPKGLLTFLGFFGNAEFSPLKRLMNSGSHKKKFAGVFVTASDVFFLFFVFEKMFVLSSFG